MGYLVKNFSKALLAGSLLVLGSHGVAAETLKQAMAKAYEANPQLNGARSELRVVNENLPQARSLFLPSINATASVGSTSVFSVTNPARRAATRNVGYGITIDQRIFNGFKSINTVRQAEAGIRAQRANVQNTEINIMLRTAQAYQSVLRDRKIISLRRQNLRFLEEQVRASRARFEVGEGTRTDVAQARAQQAAALAQVNAAQAALSISEADYRNIVGSVPGKLSAAKVPATLIPSSLDSAHRIAMNRHPAIKAQFYASDGSKFAVRIAEGNLLPSLGVRGAFNRNVVSNATGSSSQASITATLNVPLYQGGGGYSQVRQAKERLASSRINIDRTRDDIRLTLDRAWAELQSARAAVSANRAQLEAGRLALNGVSEERKVGQRTTLDVLQSQRVVIDAQIGLEQSRASQILAGYAVAAATGRLTARAMGLGVSYFDDRAHYQQVKDKWIGLRTVDGR